LPVASSPEAFGAVVANKELFDKILKTGEVCRVGDVEMYHAIVTGDPLKALSGPVTEVASMNCFVLFLKLLKRELTVVVSDKAQES
jgi:hypothetical protein